MVGDGLPEDGEPGVAQEGVFRLPLVIVQQIVLKTAKTDTIPAEDVTCFQLSPQEKVDQKLVPVGAQAFRASRLLEIQVTFHGVRDAAERKRGRGLLAE